MIRYILLWVLLFNAYSLFAQKKTLDLEGIQKWPVMGKRPFITVDGKYLAYTLTSDENRELIVKATEGSWKRHIKVGTNYGRASFTEDGHRLIFLTKSSDSLGI